MRHALLFLSLLFYLFPSPRASAVEKHAPPMTRSQSVGQLFRLNPPIYGVLRGDVPFEFEAGRTVANLWARDKRFLVDAEVIDDRARFSFLLQPWLKLGLGISSRRFAATDTDQIAISFHDLFMLGQDGRLEAGKHHTRYKIPDYNLEFGQPDRDHVLSEQIEADLSFPLLSGEAVDWQITGSLLVGREGASASPYGRGSLDYGFQLNADYPWLEGRVYAALTQVFYDRASRARTPTERQQAGWTLGTAQPIALAHELIGQLMVLRPVFRELGQLSRNSYETQFAYRYHWQKAAIELTLIENIFWLYNSPDWGLSLGLRTALY